MPTPKIAPSMLSSDFSNLANEAQKMIDYKADYLHMDIMDGHFVPNLTIGSQVVKSLRMHHKNVFLDCHLMVSEPEKWVKDFAAAGASLYCFHIEATQNPKALIENIKKAGMKVGIAIKPATPASSIVPFLPLIDQVLVMSVEPGFGGQKFMESVLPKIREIRSIDAKIDIQVDGGIDKSNIDLVSKAGANVIVAGTSIFKSVDPGEVIETFRQTVLKAN